MKVTPGTLRVCINFHFGSTILGEKGTGVTPDAPGAPDRVLAFPRGTTYGKRINDDTRVPALLDRILDGDAALLPELGGLPIKLVETSDTSGETANRFHGGAQVFFEVEPADYSPALVDTVRAVLESFFRQNLSLPINRCLVLG